MIEKELPQLGYWPFVIIFTALIIGFFWPVIKDYFKQLKENDINGIFEDTRNIHEDKDNLGI